ncbi:MAG TPA: glycosyltransferase 87 family protein [Candidatus Limnocylindria bacterium]|nr:glycosyltransferase 87 family protein [Candidatus Limnocylindria bacterium]
MTISGAATRIVVLRRLFAEPIPIGRRQLPPLGLVVLATVGALLLAVVATGHWAQPNDEHAYWLAGQRLLHGQALYEPTASANTPFAYWYPPVVAQLVAPISAILPSEAFSWAWLALLLGCTWWLAGSRPLPFLALIAFLPVATELWFRNVHLILAVLVVLAIRRWPILFAVGAAIKLSPGLGIVYLAARGRWRDAAITALAGAAMLAVSVVLAPDAWAQFAEVLRVRGPADASSFLLVPYWVRAGLGLALAVIAGRLRPRLGEPLLVVALVVALPTLWFTALSMLAALVPIVRRPSDRLEASAVA